MARKASQVLTSANNSSIVVRSNEIPLDRQLGCTRSALSFSLLRDREMAEPLGLPTEALDQSPQRSWPRKLPGSPQSGRVKTLHNLGVNTVTYSPALQYSPRGSSCSSSESLTRLKSAGNGYALHNDNTKEPHIAASDERLVRPNHASFKLVKLQDTQQVKDWFSRFARGSSVASSHLDAIEEDPEETSRISDAIPCPPEISF